ncbi:hypothetical protein [Microbacterium sp. 2FI]|uniref:hypothetical protein n=1 Tax=Microbacterium sp. 2FI TaxID=2502193 RepID=UPI0010F69F53|nr:hypothetical protein [Microbacterium sp. 2FI]
MHTKKSRAVAVVALSSALALAASPALAATSPYLTDFTGVTIDTATEPLADSWRMTGGYDATITDGYDPALRVTNAVTSGSFGDQLFSPTLDLPATESGAASTFTASFVLEPVALQPGLRVTVSPDNGQGGRGGFLAIEHTTTGLNLVTQGSSFDAAGELRWDTKVVASDLDVTKPHTVKLKLIKKPDTKKSTNNDVFSVQVDGKPVKNTTFEAYYEATGEGDYKTDTLLFRFSGVAQPSLVAGDGLLIDDVSIATS